MQGAAQHTMTDQTNFAEAIRLACKLCACLAAVERARPFHQSSMVGGWVCGVVGGGGVSGGGMGGSQGYRVRVGWLWGEVAWG